MNKVLTAIQLTMLAMLTLPSAGADESRPIDTRQLEIRLGDGTTIVVNEGRVEPRSIGSVVLSAYAPAEGEFRYDNFQRGIVWPRDGTLLRLLTTDIDSQPGDEIIVISQSAGSGGYLSATAFRWRHGVLAHVASVSDLPPAADAVDALKRALQKR